MILNVYIKKFTPLTLIECYGEISRVNQNNFEINVSINIKLCILVPIRYTSDYCYDISNIKSSK